MRLKGTCVAVLILLWFTDGLPQTFSQTTPQKRIEDQTIRITTELIQLDVVVTDKDGRVVKGLTKEDFTLFDSGKKQQISFFEFFEGGKLRTPSTSPREVAEPVSPGRSGVPDTKRIMAFVVDDLTINQEDLAFLRQLLKNFIDAQMQGGDLVAIVRTVGGKGLLQQFTMDKQLLHRAVASLTPRSHAFSAIHNPQMPRMTNPQGAMASDGPTDPSAAGAGDEGPMGAVDAAGEALDVSNPLDDTHKTLRALMSLGTASFVIDSLRELPGRKSLVLISGGLPILSSQTGANTGSVSYLLNTLTDKATRAGVAIHTMDVRGLQALSSVASFEDTPGRSMVGGSDVFSRGSRNAELSDPSAGGRYRRGPDETLLNTKSPFDAMEAQQGLRTLASATGGIAVLNRNDFNNGLGKILAATDGYYLLAYTPIDTKFDGDFHKVEVRVRGDYKVYNRRGYIAREDAVTAPYTKQEQMLAAVKSPLARRDIDFSTMLLYKAAPPDKATIDIHLVIDPKRLTFETLGDKQQASFDIAGFVFDELGKLRGGFSETVTQSLTQQEQARQIAQDGGFSYSANTSLPAGIYQIRLAVRDNKSGNIGTASRYLELPDLSKGKLSASSLLIGAVPARDTTAANPTPIPASHRISRKSDLRYATIIYNAKLKEGTPQLRTQLVISRDGREVFREPEQSLTIKDPSQVIKVGQLGLGGVAPGRYTLTLFITDTLADKRSQTITRSMDFVVVD